MTANWFTALLCLLVCTLFPSVIQSEEHESLIGMDHIMSGSDADTSPRVVLRFVAPKESPAESKPGTPFQSQVAAPDNARKVPIEKPLNKESSAAVHQEEKRIEEQSPRIEGAAGSGFHVEVEPTSQPAVRPASDEEEKPDSTPTGQEQKIPTSPRMSRPWRSERIPLFKQVMPLEA